MKMNADSFHRLMKLLVDSGEATTMEEAVNTFGNYGVRLVLDTSVEKSIPQQIIALTAINTAARSFQGNVFIAASSDITLLVPGFEGQRLSEFASWAGVATNCCCNANWPVIHLGSPSENALKGRLQPWASGWSFGLGRNVVDKKVFVPAAVAAGALAVSEAFSILRKDNPYAGRRALSLSLWSMSPADESTPVDIEPELNSGLWLIGLGHLGQAYCWTLGMIDKKSPVQLVLQDTDTVTESTLTTSMLTCPADIGRKKTRIAAEWLDARGFETKIVERLFDSNTRVAPSDPMTALFGVDNASARRCCEQAGFSLVIDAGLGSGYRDFRALRMRAFPGASLADRIWAAEPQYANAPLAAAYQAMLSSGHEPCGVTTLATRSVGAPFVGCYAAAISIAEIFKRQLTGKGNDVINVNLRDPLALELA
jgi:hypothetical protein